MPVEVEVVPPNLHNLVREVLEWVVMVLLAPVQLEETPHHTPDLVEVEVEIVPLVLVVMDLMELSLYVINMIY
tara:strand:+ start:452 stop:670 length:219 start_codon:yes stop_codon:yes gene_type:complete